MTIELHAGKHFLSIKHLPAGHEVAEKILRGRKATEHDDVLSNHLATEDFILKHVLPSKRQSSEWRVRVLESPFGLFSPANEQGFRDA